MMMMMQGAAGEPKNKEQFKLLQYSDDSKSLSDLELAEIVVPRKRKVRRWVPLTTLHAQLSL